MDSKKRYRYPGINFFTREDEDIFCGRSDDADKLFTLIMNNNTMILHGESGTGKSSLVQAGILTLLEKRNKDLAIQHKPQYLPVTIRFDSISKLSDKDKTPGYDDILIRKIQYEIVEQNGYKAKALPYIFHKSDNLWYTAKSFENNNYTFFMIFDQFEELQNFNPKERKHFARKLSELFASAMPPEIYKEYNEKTAELLNEKELTDEARKEFNENIKFLEQPLNVKVLFIIREDRLGTMSSLADYFPDILKNNFLLSPLDKNGAVMAIEEPAKKKGDFVSGRFTFDPPALEYLLQNLEDPNTNLYDPFQLQIVCGSIEKKVTEDGTEIKKNNIQKVGDILSDFYYEIWDKIKSEFALSDDVFEEKRKKIIEQLVKSGRRNLVLENLLITDGDKLDENIISSLLKNGMLKKNPSGKDTFYQLSHDRLREPLSKDLRSLEAKKDLQEQLMKEFEVKFEEEKTQSGRTSVMVLIGIIGTMLPFFAATGNLLHSGLAALQSPISDYYGQGTANDIFIGLLFALAFCLFLYRGYERIDNISAKLGGVFALGAAIFSPRSNNELNQYLHFSFILLLCLVFIFFAIFLFRRTNPVKLQTPQKVLRNKVYLACGIIMTISLIGIFSGFLFPLRSQKYHLVFWFETLMFVSFGISWLVKSGRVLLLNKYIS